ncbi:trichohyalin-like [Mercenaria mercenaria]|uniref:trichohyalin-like n=1 Tax=Mercenaria mercenaria TaxID=6596 RepID=UPI00234E3E18|nr:trichohyalin-like [Mercenaria mercenaria]
MADGPKSNTGKKARKRSKSVTSERVHHKGESHSYELIHSVSLQEKREAVKKKTRKQLEQEIIVLDASKNMVEVNLKDVNAENSQLNKDKFYLQNQLEKSEREKTNLYREMEMTKQEIFKLKTDFDAEKAILREEKSSLSSKLEKSRQEKQTLRIEFDGEKAKLEEEKRKQMEELTKERTEHWKFTHHFSKLLEDSRAKVYVTGSYKNLQVGESNIIKQDIMAQWKELADKLCVSIEDHMIKRKELEMKVRSDEVLLKEIKDSLQRILQNLKHDKTTSKRLGRDKELLEFLTSDRSDERILTDGIKQLKKHIISSKSRKDLPLAAEAAVARLLNKFDRLTIREFVEVLEGKKQKSETSQDADQTKKKEVYVERIESIQVEESSRDKPLNRTFCVDILVKWLQLSEENDAEQLLGRIKVYESKLSTEMVLEYQEEIKRKHISSDLDEMQLLKKGKGPHEDFEIPYSSLPSTQSLQGLPDALTQFMHQLEGLKIVIDIDRKVDQISDALKTVGSASNSSHANKKERNNSQGNKQESGPISNFNRQISDV